MNLPAAEAARIADEIEAQAFRAVFAAAPENLRSMLGLQVREVAGATLLIAPRMPTIVFNRAIGLGWQSPASPDDTQAIAAIYREAGVKEWWLHWNPFAQPVDMPARLAEIGWRAPERRSWAKMIRSPDAPPRIDTPLRVEPADDSTLPQAAAVVAHSFDMPPFMAGWLASQRDGPWRPYALLDEDHVVGGAWLFLGGEAAWLGIAGVAPSHRGRRGQAALMARRIADAGTAGAHWVVTETGEPTSAGEANPSLENMRRCGFECVASRLNFAPPP